MKNLTKLTYAFRLAALLVLTTIAAQAQQSTNTAVTPNPADADRGYLIKVGDQAPDDFELVMQNGQKTSLKQLRGKVAVLQFTASWCSV